MGRKTPSKLAILNRQIYISRDLNALARSVNKDILDVYRESNHAPGKEYIVLRFKGNVKEYIDITDLNIYEMREKFRKYLGKEKGYEK